VTSGSVLQADYVAPGALPQPNPVTVQVASTADPTKSATTQITVINHVLVSVQPQSAALAPLAVQGFTATVLGTANQSVVLAGSGSGMHRRRGLWIGQGKRHIHGACRGSVARLNPDRSHQL